jgi:hypothetical protein
MPALCTHNSALIFLALVGGAVAAACVFDLNDVQGLDGGVGGASGTGGLSAGSGGSIGSCVSPLTACEEECRDLSSDVANCGVCTNKCTSTIGKASCQNSICSSGDCNAWQIDCNGREDDGCETRMSEDVHNCGGCGIRCPAGFECRFGSCNCTDDPDCNWGSQGECIGFHCFCAMASLRCEIGQGCLNGNLCANAGTGGADAAAGSAGTPGTGAAAGSAAASGTGGNFGPGGKAGAGDAGGTSGSGGGGTGGW